MVFNGYQWLMVNDDDDHDDDDPIFIPLQGNCI